MFHVFLCSLFGQLILISFPMESHIIHQQPQPQSRSQETVNPSSCPVLLTVAPSPISLPQKGGGPSPGSCRTPTGIHQRSCVEVLPPAGGTRRRRKRRRSTRSTRNIPRKSGPTRVFSNTGKRTRVDEGLQTHTQM